MSSLYGGEQGDEDPRRRGRRRWLILGGALGAVIVAIFAAALPLQPGFAAVVISAGVALYAAMVMVALAVTRPRRRNIALAWLMILLALLGLISVVVLYTVEMRAG